MREDEFTNTPEDAAAYERARSADDVDDRPTLAELQRDEWLASEPVDAWDAHEMDEARAHLEAVRDARAALVRVGTVLLNYPHADTCATELSPDAGYECSCWRAGIWAAVGGTS